MEFINLSIIDQKTNLRKLCEYEKIDVLLNLVVVTDRTGFR
jgi:hypothetical protein